IISDTVPFDPADPETFNWSTSVPVYDSLGNVHTMTQYFAKREGPLESDSTKTGVYWDMYTLIDGLNPYQPASTTHLKHVVEFNASGRLTWPTSGDIMIEGDPALGAG